MVGKDDQTKIFDIVPSQEALLIFNTFVAIMNCQDNLLFLFDYVNISCIYLSIFLSIYIYIYKEQHFQVLKRREKTPEIKFIHTFTQLHQLELAVVC